MCFVQLIHWKLNSRQTAKYTEEMHFREPFYLPKDLYCCSTSPEDYTALPHSIALSGRRRDLIFFCCSSPYRSLLMPLLPPPVRTLLYRDRERLIPGQIHILILLEFEIIILIIYNWIQSWINLCILYLPRDLLKCSPKKFGWL